MQIKHHTIVQYHYHLRLEQGDDIETTRGGDPVTYMHGQQQIIKGLEQAMLGKETGDIFSVTITPENGYGQRKDADLQRVPIKHLLGVKKPKLGEIVSVNTGGGVRHATVVKVGRFNVDIDANHPLAGKTLVFDIEVVSVRAATADEIDHGHAHGAGGH